MNAQPPLGVPSSRATDRAGAQPGEVGSALKLLEIYYEPAPAGQTRHVFALTQALTRRRHCVTVVLPKDLLAHPPSTVPWRTQQDGAGQPAARIVPLPMRKLLWPRESLLELARMIRQEAPQIVHVHSLEAGFCGRAVSWLANLSYLRDAQIVYTPQTIDIRQTRWHRLYRLLERLLAGVTDAIVSVNEADRQRLIRWGIPPHRVVTIPNGIDVQELAPLDLDRRRALRQSLCLDPDRPLVMQVARLSAQKDPLTFVEGAALLARQHPRLQFAMVGQGPLREAVASRIRRLDLQEHVHMLGWRDQAHRLMAAANVVTLTSRWEGSPYSLLEAMAASRPVVAPRVNGCSEIVLDRETGYLVAPGDVSGWAAAVVRLLNDPARAAEMGNKARERVKMLYSIHATVTRTEALYQSLVKGRSDSP